MLSASLTRSLSSLVRSAFLFNHKTQLVSYLILCVAKMPFIPPVSIARSVSGLTAKERPINKSSSSATLTKIQREDRGSSVKERLASNLKQLGKKSQPRSRLPTARAAPGSELHVKRGERELPSSLPDSFSGESLSKTQQHKHVSCVQSEAEAKHPEEVRFTLTLTPEAVLLLQRRNTERRQHSASRHTGSGGASESRRRREHVSKRHHQPVATQRQSAPNSSDAAEQRDVSHILRISLLNERHKYDDVEYEEEEQGVDERVVLKCTEWLRGLENTPVTVGHGLSVTEKSV